MNKIVEQHTAKTTTSDTAADNILSAVKDDAAGFEKILKFRKGDYLVKDDIVPLDTEFLAHASAWTKTWIKFVDDKVVERKLYRVAKGERPPERDELDDQDQATWRKNGIDGSASDPWVLQDMLPLENLSTGELLIFATASVGGHQAVRDVCSAYAKRVKKQGSGQLIIKLATADMPSKKYGKVMRPDFVITGWEDTVAEEELATAIPTHTGKAAAKKRQHADDDMNDEIPF